MPKISVSLALAVVLVSIITGAAVPDDLRIREARVRFETRDGAPVVRAEARKLRLNRVSGSELRAIVPIASVRTGNPGLDERIRKRLDIERCPDAVFAFDPRSISAKAPRDGEFGYRSVRGRLMLGCRSQPVRGIYTVGRGDRKLTFSGGFRIDLQEYGIEECSSGRCGSIPGNVLFRVTIDEPW